MKYFLRTYVGISHFYQNLTRQRVDRERTMSRTCVRHITLITSALLLSVGIIIATMNIASLYVAARGNASPPAIADGLFVHWDRTLWGDDDRKLAAIVEKTFPIGGTQSQLTSALAAQGFRPSAVHGCVLQGDLLPIATAYYRCSPQPNDPNKELAYDWSKFPCRQTIRIWWETQDNGVVTHVFGEHSGGCI